jgi:hypothetical protein
MSASATTGNINPRDAQQHRASIRPVRIGNMNRRKFMKRSLVFAGTLGFGTMYWKNRWKYIVIHHSAGSFGNIDFLQRVHRQRQGDDPIDAIPYHFIIGNGNGLAMGETAHDWRRQYNIWGAHVSNRNFDYNFRGIGICLIGNFENEKIPPKQYQSLRHLTQTLMSKYDILPENVTGHGMITGESTKCPGRFFPMERLKKELQNKAPAMARRGEGGLFAR